MGYTHRSCRAPLQGCISICIHPHCLNWDSLNEWDGFTMGQGLQSKTIHPIPFITTNSSETLRPIRFLITSTERVYGRRDALLRSREIEFYLSSSPVGPLDAVL